MVTKKFNSDEMTSNLLSVKETFGNVLVELGESNENIIVGEADVMKSAGTRPFMERFPERHFQFGVAEQNLMGVAAGLALSGKIVFANTFANFATKRACDQISMSIAYNEANVKICGDYAGLTSAKNGGTHISVEDIAIMRSMPNMRVIVPADTIELADAVRVIAQYEGPVYLRKVRGPMRRLFSDDYRFAFGRAVEMTEGDDLTIITCGITTALAMDAARELERGGLHARVINMSTIKPLDKNAIIKAAETTGAVLTVENHNIMGGLGSAAAETLLEADVHPLFRRMGIGDRFGETATLDWLLENHGLSTPHIVKPVFSFLKSHSARIPISANCSFILLL